MAPKPILKHSAPSANNNSPSHAVHFPPSPSLTRTFSAYSATAYDRSPIVVSPNNCALPERGCPGRTYLLDETAATQAMPRGLSNSRTYHPRALAFRSRPAEPVVPALVADLSSESDESDLPIDYPTNNNFGMHGLARPAHQPAIYSSNYHTRYPHYDDDAGTLAFLPYSPAASPPSSPYQYEDSDDAAKKPQRRRPSRERKHDSSRDPDRIRSGGGYDTQYSLSTSFNTLSLAPSPPPSPTSPQKRSSRRPGQASSFGGGFGLRDDGCLGGF